VFASWDGEEYSLIGSTEWVEEYLPWLSEANVAYVNVDVGVDGPEFTASAAPLLNQIIRDVTSAVPSPNQTVPGQTVNDLWSKKISTMGSGSDFTAFQDFAGIPCIDFGFKYSGDSAVYHYHSNYDSFYWMKEYGDVGFKYHRTMAQVLGLTIAKLAGTVIIPFSATEYADALEGYLDKVEAKFEPAAETLSYEELFNARGAVLSNKPIGSEDDFKRSLEDIRKQLGEFHLKATERDAEAESAQRELEEGIPWWNIVKKIRLGYTIVRVNKRYKFLERSFLYEGGLDGRDWFKHVVFAPGIWTGYAGGKWSI
jgi:N-acetylated-alpha-linked acidic dipeptidase